MSSSMECRRAAWAVQQRLRAQSRGALTQPAPVSIATLTTCSADVLASQRDERWPYARRRAARRGQPLMRGVCRTCPPGCPPGCLPGCLPAASKFTQKRTRPLIHQLLLKPLDPISPCRWRGAPPQQLPLLAVLQAALRLGLLEPPSALLQDPRAAAGDQGRTSAPATPRDSSASRLLPHRAQTCRGDRESVSVKVSVVRYRLACSGPAS